MKKLMLLGLVVALLGALIMPGTVAAQGESELTACDPDGSELTGGELRELGPLMLGMERIFRSDTYGGLGISLITGEHLLWDLEAITLDGFWGLSLIYGAPHNGLPQITGGQLTGGGVLPEGQIVEGRLLDLGGAMPELVGNWLIEMKIDTDGDGEWDLWYGGMLLEDLSGMLDLLPEILEGLLASYGDSAGDSDGAVTMPDTGGRITIPVGPFIDLIAPLFPVLAKLLPAVIPILKPLVALLPPIIMIMPVDVFAELIELFPLGF